MSARSGAGRPLPTSRTICGCRPSLLSSKSSASVTLEEWVEAELELGRESLLVAELEALTRAYPLRERLRFQLMLALYRSGRQADALRVYRETRELLVEELGIEPGRELQQLERRILVQDELLAPPRQTGPRRSRSRRRRSSGGRRSSLMWRGCFAGRSSGCSPSSGPAV